METVSTTEETMTNRTDDIPPTANGRARHAKIVLLLLLIAGMAAGSAWWYRSKTHISTDNAFIESQVHSVSSRVAGTVRDVQARDNRFVRQGDLLLEIDPANYRARLMNATAALEMSRNETSGEYAQVEGARAALSLAKARLEQADIDLRRGEALFAREVIPREQLDRLSTAQKVSALQVRQAEETLSQAKALAGLSGDGGREARIAQKKAVQEEAELNLSYTRITAPADGYITRKSVETGNYVQPGQPLMAIVRLEDAWITANYKERQLTHVKPGQSVLFKVDAYPGMEFRGRVESIMAGTGAAFSLLPPENASGNYVKVVQRIPVKIVIDRTSDPGHLLRVGMSVTPEILVERSLSDIMGDLNPFR